MWDTQSARWDVNGILWQTLLFMKIELYIYKVKGLNSQVSSDNLMVCGCESHGVISQSGEEACIGCAAVRQRPQVERWAQCRSKQLLGLYKALLGKATKQYIYACFTEFENQGRVVQPGASGWVFPIQIVTWGCSHRSLCGLIAHWRAHMTWQEVSAATGYPWQNSWLPAEGERGERRGAALSVVMLLNQLILSHLLILESCTIISASFPSLKTNHQVQPTFQGSIIWREHQRLAFQIKAARQDSPT